MPIYRYRCIKCSEESTKIHGIKDKPNIECSRDGCEGRMKKTVARTSFSLKGGGWYRDGYNG